MSKHHSTLLVSDQLETVVASPGETADQPSTPVEMDERAPSDEQDVAARAYRRWLERGCPQGSSDVDWFEAERELHSKSGSK